MARKGEPIVVPGRRRRLIAGNWKMNYNHFEAIALTQKIAFSLDEEHLVAIDVAVLPPFTDIRSVQTLVDADQLLLKYGAQDASPHDSGAFTGDVSGPMLAKLGCTYVLAGHSERREHHGEDDAQVNAKVTAIYRNEMTPILCVGETLGVRDAGGHLEHARAQLRAGLTGVSAEQAERLVVAYEPVWAIGTGKTASAEDAQEVCAALRAALGELYSAPVADEIRILYGGSVKSTNVAEILDQPDIDGALVGGASLDAVEFAAICKLACGLGAAASSPG